MMWKYQIQLGALLPTVLLAASCVSPNPDYCDETRPCSDEARPFCDLEGTYAASDYTAHLCISDPGVADGGRPDSDSGSPDAGSDGTGTRGLQSETTEHDFGSVSRGGQSTLLTVTVENGGQVPTGEIATSLGGPNASEMVIIEDECAQAVLGLGETCEVQLRMVPKVVGTKDARLDVSADPGGGLSIDLSGTGMAPAALKLEITSFDFGVTTPGATSASQIFSVRNEGAVASGAIDVSFDALESFIVSKNDCGGTLAPGASCDVQVVFSPSTTGAHNGTLIMEADPGGRTTVALMGTGKVAVSVTLGGTGQGEVTSAPAGIACGAKCDADFTSATMTLTAQAQDGSCFVGWFGGCTGRSATCAPTLNQAQSVQANFEKSELFFTLTTTASGSDAPFDPEIGKDGCVLMWDLGDGSPRIMANGISHIYTTVGETTVSVFSAEGGAGVTSIDFRGDGLAGEIPAALGQLSEVRVLELSTNRFNGEIPASLGNLSNLEHLNVYENQLTGEIPASLGDLSKLQSLHLAVNQLSGTIPTALGSLSKLTSLDLANNQLTGEIPAWLGSLSKLTNLDLAHNQLTGEIPASLGDLANLRELRLGGNRLSGTIPAWLGSLSELGILSLSSTQLTGEVPAVLGNLSKLRSLYLGNVAITDVAAGVFNRLTQINHIYLAGAALTQQAVDAVVDQIYQARGSYDNTRTKKLSLDGGTNASPSASSMTKINTLETDTYKWQITCSGC